MATIKKHFYAGKGDVDAHPWLYYGEEPPIITPSGTILSTTHCEFVGGFSNNPIADSIKDNEIIKIYIRKEIKKNK